MSKNSRSPKVEFIRQYANELEALSTRMERKRPDYIVSISRSGPRLIELLEKKGIYSPSAPVITEKSLNFIPNYMFDNSNIVVFDDVTNTGKTIHDIQLQIDAKYDPEEIDPITFGYDHEISQIDPETANPQLEISTSKRHEVIKHITQSFSHLNKPYDVDHPIFYSSVDSEQISSFEAQDNTYELTSVYQDSLGYRRYTHRPSPDDRINELLPKLLQVDIGSDISKVRTYYDTKSDQFLFVPIVSFPIQESSLEKELFVDELPDEYNDLLKTARETLDSREVSLYRVSRSQVLYRLLWYIVNYLHGIAYQLEYRKAYPEIKSVKSALSEQDLEYLFGPTLSGVIITVLDRVFDQTVDSIVDILDRSPPEFEYNHPHRDSNQEEIYDDVLSYLENNLVKSTTYSDKVSTIFEGIQLTFESDTDIEMRSQVDAPRNRLERDTGLNMHDIKELLAEAGVDQDGTFDLEVSLALDFLIDAGVVIPMFYEKKNSEYLERGFRHGEGALNRMGFSYVMDAVIDELFAHTDDTVSRIGLEKIGVMVTDRLHNGRYWGGTRTSSIYDFLKGDALSKRIDVSPEFHRYGKVVLLEETPELDNYFFTEWCEDMDMVYSTKRGVQRGRGWKHKYQNDINQVESTIENSEVAALESLATLLYDVNDIIDENNPDYITALTTCRDPKSYIKSIRKEMQLFFSHEDWSMSESIKHVRSLCNKYDSYSPDSFIQLDTTEISSATQKAIENRGNSHAAISAIDRKKRLKEELHSDIIPDIRDYFKRQDGAYRRNYEQNLKPYLDNIEAIDEYESSQVDEIISKSELFGEVCIQFSKMYETTLELMKKAAGRETSLRPEISELNSQIKDFNNIITKNSGKLYSGPELGDVPILDRDQIGIDSIGSENTFDEEELQNDRLALIIMQDVIEKEIEIYDSLEEIHNAYYEGKNWNRTMDGVFQEKQYTEVNWVVWYDMMDSSAPENSEQTEQLKSNIEDQLEMISSYTDDGEFEKSDDDDKHIFISEDDNVDRFVREILREAELLDMKLRLSVCSVPSGSIRWEDGRIKTTEAHVRAESVGEYMNEHNNEKAGYHYLSVCDGTNKELWSDNDLPDEITQDWGINTEYNNDISLKDEDISMEFTTYEVY